MGPHSPRRQCASLLVWLAFHMIPGAKAGSEIQGRTYVSVEIHSAPGCGGAPLLSYLFTPTDYMRQLQPQSPNLNSTCLTLPGGYYAPSFNSGTCGMMRHTSDDCSGEGTDVTSGFFACSPVEQGGTTMHIQTQCQSSLPENISISCLEDSAGVKAILDTLALPDRSCMAGCALPASSCNSLNNELDTGCASACPAEIKDQFALSAILNGIATCDCLKTDAPRVSPIQGLTVVEMGFFADAGCSIALSPPQVILPSEAQQMLQQMWSRSPSSCMDAGDGSYLKPYFNSGVCASKKHTKSDCSDSGEDVDELFDKCLTMETQGGAMYTSMRCLGEEKITSDLSCMGQTVTKIAEKEGMVDTSCEMACGNMGATRMATCAAFQEAFGAGGCLEACTGEVQQHIAFRSIINGLLKCSCQLDLWPSAEPQVRGITYITKEVFLQPGCSGRAYLTLTQVPLLTHQNLEEIMGALGSRCMEEEASGSYLMSYFDNGWCYTKRHARADCSDAGVEVHAVLFGTCHVTGRPGFQLYSVHTCSGSLPSGIDMRCATSRGRELRSSLGFKLDRFCVATCGMETASSCEALKALFSGCYKNCSLDMKHVLQSQYIINGVIGCDCEIPELEEPPAIQLSDDQMEGMTYVTREVWTGDSQCGGEPSSTEVLSPALQEERVRQEWARGFGDSMDCIDVDGSYLRVSYKAGRCSVTDHAKSDCSDEGVDATSLIFDSCSGQSTGGVKRSSRVTCSGSLPADVRGNLWCVSASAYGRILSGKAPNRDCMSSCKSVKVTDCGSAQMLFEEGECGAACSKEVINFAHVHLVMSGVINCTCDMALGKKLGEAPVPTPTPMPTPAPSPSALGSSDEPVPILEPKPSALGSSYPVGYEDEVSSTNAAAGGPPAVVASLRLFAAVAAALS